MNFLNNIPNKNKNLAWRIIDDEAAVIPLENQPGEGGELIIFNETATRVWQLIDGERTVREIIKQLIEEYAIETEEIESQISELINDMLHQKMITI